ncbi:MAG: hypothetical protein F7C38_02100 [Desulfurococcales archaeon]|nr:hypothetical protein [Desulfurococcales archaeon]
MESRKWLGFLLVLIAVIASLEYLPRDLLVRVAIPQDASYPLNEGPSGTSILWRALEKRGFKTKIVYGLSGMPDLAGYKDLVYLAVGGVTREGTGLKEAYSLLEKARARGLRIHYVLLDEAPTPPVRDLTRQASLLICGSIPPQIRGILNSTISTFYGLVQGEGYDIPTGFTGYITFTGDPIVYPVKPLLPQELNSFTAIAAAWPYPAEPYQGKWYIVGVECRSARGSVVLIADSTIAVNLVTGTYNKSLDYIVNLIADRVASPETTLVVSDEELYVAPGNENVQLILSLHPSILLLAASRLYGKAESVATSLMAKKGLTPLLIAGIASILASAALYSSLPPRTGKEGRRGSRIAGFGAILSSLKTLFAPLDSVVPLCSIASRYLELPVSGVSHNVERELNRLKDSIVRECSRVERMRVFSRFLPVWGLVKRRLESSLVVYLSLAGIYDYEEAQRVVKGGGSGRG